MYYNYQTSPFSQRRASIVPLSMATLNILSPNAISIFVFKNYRVIIILIF